MNRELFTLLGGAQTNKDIERASISKILCADLRDNLIDMPLYDACTQLLALYRYDKSLISGDILASLAKKLVTSEKSVGGPYVSDRQHTTFATNAAIAQLFRVFGTPLPNVEAYLHKNERRVNIARNIETLWIALWPYPLITTTSTTAILQEQTIPGAIRRVLPSDFVARQPSNSATNPTKQQVHTDIDKLPQVVRSSMKSICNMIDRADAHGEISSINRTFLASLRKTPSIHISAEKLDIANYYTWMAYSIYDDFIDDEGTAALLPAANIAHRNALALYSEATTTHDLRQLIVQCFDNVDAANTWELFNCRFETTDATIIVGDIPNYRDGNILYERAGPHTLGIQFIARQTCTDRQCQTLSKGLASYIIARQINDDLHDWKDDLRRGHISYVVAHLLAGSGTNPGKHSLESLGTKLADYFWETGLLELLDTTEHFVDQAYRLFDESSTLVPDSPLTQLTLAPIKMSVQQAKSSLQNQRRFLRTYNHDIYESG